VSSVLDARALHDAGCVEREMLFALQHGLNPAK
jgi:hypothetical protein